MFDNERKMSCDIYQHLTFLEIGNCKSDGAPLIVFGDLTERKKAHYLKTNEKRNVWISDGEVLKTFRTDCSRKNQ